MNNKQTDKHQHTDVLVVGGGVIGIATAHYLQEQGLAVTVIDQGKMGQGSSHGNCGYICPSHLLPLAEPGRILAGFKALFNPRSAFKFKPQWRLAYYRWLYQFAKRCQHDRMMAGAQHLKSILDDSQKAYRRLFETTDINAQWQESGLLYVFQTAKGLDGFSRTNDLLSAHFNTPAEFIHGRDLPDFDPALKSDLAGAYHYPNDASLSPSQLISRWVDRLKGQGVRFVEQCQLIGIEKQDKQIKSIKTNQGQWRADAFVMATGAWSSHWAEQLGLSIPVEPCKGYSVTMGKPDVCPQVPMLFSEHHVGVTPFEDTLRLGSMIEFAGFNTHIPPSRINQLYQSVTPYLRSRISRDNEQPWFGWRPMTWDSLPIIGRVPRVSNAYLATGHNMLGMTLAPATGKMVAAMITGDEPDIDPSPFAPDRF